MLQKEKRVKPQCSLPLSSGRFHELAGDSARREWGHHGRGSPIGCETARKKKLTSRDTSFTYLYTPLVCAPS